MSDVTLNDRQKAVIKAVQATPGITAAGIHGYLAENGIESKDARGAAQTARRMPEYVSRTDGGNYNLTALGKRVAQSL